VATQIVEECLGLRDDEYAVVRYQERARQRLMNEIHMERWRQNVKFTGTPYGIQKHNVLTWACILNEESGEVTQAALQTVFGGSNLNHFREELIQTIAVAMAIVERIDDEDSSLTQTEKLPTL